MNTYSYRLKPSAKDEKMNIDGILLTKEKEYFSKTRVDFKKFNFLVIEKVIKVDEEVVINIQKKKEKRIIKQVMDLTKVSKASLIEHIIYDTKDPLLKDKTLLMSLKKTDLISIIDMIRED